MKPADESLVVMNKTKFLPKYSTKKSFSQSAGNNLNISPSSIPLQIDPSLLRVMREHQIEAANFILNCFSPTTPSQTLTTTDDDDDFYNSPKSSLNTALMRGAILADDMGISIIFRSLILTGLGKTLTAISVLWAYLKGGKCKGLIICPSSLVENWEKEVRIKALITFNVDRFASGWEFVLNHYV